LDSTRDNTGDNHHHPPPAASLGDPPGTKTVRDMSGDASFHPPGATVVQILPSHESSVGALAVGSLILYDGHPAERSGRALIVSGGGKMEARAWCCG
ncbi:unnamed protein product, partial [Ectocarpus sp. 12 AP-2014]